MLVLLTRILLLCGLCATTNLIGMSAVAYPCQSNPCSYLLLLCDKRVASAVVLCMWWMDG